MSSEYRALCRKAWLESRQRFAWSLVALCALSVTVVLASSGFRRGYAIQYPTDPLPYAKYVWLGEFNFYFEGAWIFAAVLFAFGGLAREEALGTASYTLGLPVRRSALAGCRFVIGMLESAFVGVVPALLIPIFSPAVHESYPVTQAVQFGTLLVAGGLLFFSFGFLLSSVFRGEFTAPVIGLCAVGAYFFAIRAKSLHRLSVLDVMSGEDVLNRTTYALVSLPWSGLLLSLLAAAVLYLITLQITRTQDFR